ncbi:MAG TPA: GNAT family N-acetyltransferase [Candidatus Limnocylindrales bacterium]|nr:GNAT family N-acetyltransferase [Candidatus Limnocylindrales bacterium]
MTSVESVARIETDRLVLRERLPSDAEAWGPLLTDPDFRRYVPVRRSTESPADRARRTLDALMQRWQSDPLDAVGWVITLRDDGTVMGTGGVDTAEDPGDREIDYMLGKPFWGQGFGREAAHAMARFVLEHLSFRRLIAYIVPGNEASIRIAEGLGLRYERDVNYLEFFPEPSQIELSSPVTRMYAAKREQITLRDGFYRVSGPASTVVPAADSNESAPPG